ncbi:glycosyltransferase family 4 protein [Cyanobacteria bacterium FACHB-DQ100]|uniref:glycosyltransferase family 4 protein n=1 Tax=Leptolyngbya sp. DQ-M1 TaxID=2933920 RepID=UPI0019C8DAF0|nr:glycosyltransferase family 4 protein [Cyanobacteria bacterium FACHB-DQ100]
MLQANILATGEAPYIARHNFLFQALASRCNQVQILQRENEWYDAKIPRLLLKYVYALRVFSKSKADTLYEKNKREFIAKSRRFEQAIKQLEYKPDLVFHLLNTFSPLWDQQDIPYVLLLDYTMRLSEKSEIPWGYFLNRTQREEWLECEQQLFEKAKHLFVQSHVVRRSLIEDYQIPSDRITVVGGAGDFLEPYQGKKTFGSQQILFNGSDFQRKGGDLVLAAFEQVRQVLPDAKLVLVGRKLLKQRAGVENPGDISREQLKQLFLASDIVAAPAPCDPFPRFIMEAMNYGVPCIVSDRDGMPEIVDHQHNGIVLDQLTPDALAAAMIDLLSHPARLESMSQAARHKIRTQLNWDAVADTIVQVLSAGTNEGNSDESSDLESKRASSLY